MKRQILNQSASIYNAAPMIIENGKIIKLIKQKIYPLHMGNRSALLFPKLKEQYHQHGSKEINDKKYVQIQIKEKEEKVGITDIEEQLLHKYKISTKNNIEEHKTENNKQRSFKTGLSVRPRLNQKKPSVKLCQDEQKYHSHYQSPELSKIIDEQDDQLKLSNKSYKDLQRNQNFLNNIRDSLQNKKRAYVSTLKLSQALQDTVNKQNYNFQYLVNQFQNERFTIQTKKQNSVSAYEEISPNKLQDFISIFKSNKRKMKKFQSLDLPNEQLSTDDLLLKALHLTRNNSRKNTKLLQEESQISIENLMSAKLRMKSNHKRMIELNKGKNN